jgi:hypothetical protein
MDKRIIVPRVVVRPILPPPLEIGAQIRPQWLHWQVGRYREKLSFGPGGEGKARIWVPEKEGEQHNLILTQFYDVLIPQYGLIRPSFFAAVGTGSTAPDPTQTQLAAEIGTSSSPRRTSYTPPDQRSEIDALATYGVYDIRRVLEFSEAQVGGLNLTEWGFSPVSSRNGPLMTRELFRDGSGNPVVLTIESDQRLRLIYRYRVTLSPTSPQDVSVNIGGDGPGIRTAKFTLTGTYFVDSPTNYEGVHLLSDSAYRTRRGDLLVVDRLTRGSATGSRLSHVAVTRNAVPLTYIHSQDRLTTEPSKELSYEAPVGRSRRASVLFQPTEANITIKSVVLNSFFGLNNNINGPAVNLVFDAGQEFTKDSLHRLFIGYWQVTWGP